jgi:hypothetical protein
VAVTQLDLVEAGKGPLKKKKNTNQNNGEIEVWKPRINVTSQQWLK